MSAAAPQPNRPAPVYLPFGGLGAGLTLLFAARLAAMLGPGGDLRVAAFDAFGLALALVPTWGFVLWRSRRPLRQAAAWLFGALLALCFLPPIAYFVRAW